MIRVKTLEGKGYLVCFNVLASVGVKIIDFFLEVQNVDRVLSQKTLRSKLFDLLMLQFFKKKVFLYVGKVLMQVV
jgi:hypothetical protein